MRKVLRKIWRIIRIPFFVILVLYIGVVIYRIPAAIERSDTKEAVDFIHSQRLTMDDVLGKNIPPKPDAKLNNSTLQGIDANNNGIRDDAELAIFKLYPDSARQRSGALQYAKALQMHFSDKIFNSKTFVAVIQEEGRGESCFYHSLPSKDIKSAKTDAEASKAFAVKDIQKENLYNLIMNTKERKNKEETNYEKYMTTFSSLGSPYCDIDPLTLDN